MSLKTSAKRTAYKRQLEQYKIAIADTYEAYLRRNKDNGTLDDTMSEQNWKHARDHISNGMLERMAKMKNMRVDQLKKKLDAKGNGK